MRNYNVPMFAIAEYYIAPPQIKYKNHEIDSVELTAVKKIAILNETHDHNEY